MDPALALTVFAGAASCNIAIEFGFTGPNSTNGMSCASGAIAIGEAFRAIVRGEADAMVAGGAEAPLAPLCFGASPSSARCPPGTMIRRTPVALRLRPGRFRDGGGRRGAGAGGTEPGAGAGGPIYAEVCGFGLTNDAHHMTAPRPTGSRRPAPCATRWPRPASLPHEVGYINAHGSSTPLNDPTETSSIKQVFGDHAYRLAFSGTKGYYGHALGASGAIEAAICALASRATRVPPTVNLDSPDPACDLTHVTGHGPRARARLSAEQFLRVWRHQCGAALSASRVGAIRTRLLSVRNHACLPCHVVLSPKPWGLSAWLHRSRR